MEVLHPLFFVLWSFPRTILRKFVSLSDFSIQRPLTFSWSSPPIVFCTSVDVISLLSFLVLLRKQQKRILYTCRRVYPLLPVYISMETVSVLVVRSFSSVKTETPVLWIIRDHPRRPCEKIKLIQNWTLGSQRLSREVEDEKGLRYGVCFENKVGD